MNSTDFSMARKLTCKALMSATAQKKSSNISVISQSAMLWPCWWLPGCIFCQFRL